MVLCLLCRWDADAARSAAHGAVVGRVLRLGTHHFVRSRRNGRLYWIANIVPEPPQNNGPRYPLCIGEIDEDKVAVRKDSLMVIDDRRPDEPEGLQLSSFSVLENREMLDIEIMLTRLGEVPGHFWQGAVYRYTFSPS